MILIKVKLLILVENVVIPTATVGTQHLINKFSDLIRTEIGLCGYTECLNWCLCSIEEITTKINSSLNNYITISNPKTKEF